MPVDWKTFVRVAGIAGIGLGILFKLFGDTLQYVSRSLFDLGPRAAYQLFYTCLVLTFCIAALSMVLWLFDRWKLKSGIEKYVATFAFVLMFFVAMFAVVFTPILIANEPPKSVTENKSTTEPPVPAPQTAPITTIQTALNVCVGERSERCGSGWIHLPCGSSIEAWAAQSCISAAVTKLSDDSGNQCGYYRARVECIKAAN